MLLKLVQTKKKVLGELPQNLRKHMQSYLERTPDALIVEVKKCNRMRYLQGQYVYVCFKESQWVITRHCLPTYFQDFLSAHKVQTRLIYFKHHRIVIGSWVVKPSEQILNIKLTNIIQLFGYVFQASHV